MKRRTFASAALSLLTLPSWSTPTDSVYQLDLRLTDQSGQNRALDALRGRPVLVTMFYTSCQMACPMLIEAIRANEAALTQVERDKISVMMVSFDVERDTVEVLRNTARDRGLSAPHWTLARTDARSVRRLAAVLGIQYRQMPDGDFNHSSTVLLLDGEGRIAARTNRLSGADASMVRRIKALTA